MNRHKMVKAGWLLGLSSLVLFSCQKDDASSDATVTVSDTSLSATESVGTVSVTLSLAAAASEDVTVNYTLGGTAILNGDYETDNESSVTIPAGSTSTTISFTVFDDAVLEDDKTIEIDYTSASGATLDATQTVITIYDNDEDKSDEGLQTDLTWDAGTMVDMDLYLMNNVVINSSNEVEDYNIVSSSENEKGFESVFIDNGDVDGEYYVVVSYNSGDRDVDYGLHWYGPSIDEDGGDTFAASEVGYAYFWGPVTKSGSTYSRQAGSFDLTGLTPHLFKGSIHK